MKFYIVDCFAEEKYQGNQLLVIKADRKLSDKEQQQIAKEINFSETSFILSDKKEDGGYDVRIYTPNMELPFAGHPTLGTAYVIKNVIEKDEPSDMVKLNMKAGQIPVLVSKEGMTMMQNDPSFGITVNREEVAEVYGIGADEIRDDFPIEYASTGLEAVIVPLKNRESLKKLVHNKEAFKKYVERHPECYCNHLFFVDMGEDRDGKKVLAARCLMEDFVEDPATGSANGNLAGYMIRHSFFGCQDVSYTVIQGEDMGRKSILRVRAAKDENGWTIEVGGNCYIIASGEWE